VAFLLWVVIIMDGVGCCLLFVVHDIRSSLSSSSKMRKKEEVDSLFRKMKIYTCIHNIIVFVQGVVFVMRVNGCCMLA
jgi:hypothetical protein